MHKTTWALFAEIFVGSALFAYYFPFLPISVLERIIGVLGGVASLLGLLGVIWRGIIFILRNNLRSWVRKEVVMPLGMLTVLSSERIMNMAMSEVLEQKEKAEKIAKALLPKEE